MREPAAANPNQTRLDELQSQLDRVVAEVDTAESSDAVHVGDLIATVNGEDVAGKDHGQVIGHVRASSRPLEIGFLTGPASQLEPSFTDQVEEDVPKGFIQLVAEELQWEDDTTQLSAKETVDRACADLGIDIANCTTHEAADLVAQQLGIPGLVDDRSMNSSLASVALMRPRFLR